MCIRDRYDAEGNEIYAKALGGNLNDVGTALLVTGKDEFFICLLYTSDAADERSSVDLGGRRIIKKKKTETRDRHGDYKIKKK